MTMTGTPRSSTPIAAPWPRPNSPLPPHKLAKLANALGVATPLPATHNVPTISAPPPEGPQSPADSFRRSPSPFPSSSSTVTAYSTATSRFLLQVIPPLHLPHESDRNDHHELVPAPPNASGYHPQFRRGVLVPFYSNYQSQLGAIAKEYALPSTTGMILYLVNSKGHSQSTNEPDDAAELDDPGPRLSEDIWRHLWTRVIRSEPRDDMLLLPSRSPTPNFAPSASSESGDQPPLRSLISTNGLGPNRSYPLTPTTPSSVTTSDDRSNSRAPFSDLDTAETSSLSSASVMIDRAAKRASSLDLPGLHSSSLIPILAKVEFDIDRRRAGWYDAWMRSRRINHAKRAESRHGRRDTEGGGDEEEEQKRLPIGLLTGTKESASLISMYPSAEISQPDAALSTEGYEPLSDPQEETSGSDSGELEEEVQGAEDSVARIASMHGDRDPLADVFGADADTWAEMRGARDSKHTSNPNVMGLALTGADLTPDPTSEGLGDGEFEGGIDGMQETDEVQDLLDQMSHPQVSISPHSPPQVASPPQGSSKKHVPPPLVLQPMAGSIYRDLVVPADLSPNPSTPGSTGLAYLQSPHSPPTGESEHTFPHDKSGNYSGDDDLSLDYNHVRSPEESEKRGGALFEELDLGLQIEPSEDFEYDEDDPNDRRRSQYVMKTKLDEIEKAFAQLSPRMLNIDLQDEQTQSLASASLSISNGLLDAPPAASPIIRNADIFPPTPTHPGALSRSNRDSDLKHAAWPAIPVSALNEAPSSQDKASSNNLPPSAPRLALNGVTTSAPAPRTSHDVSPETEQRKRELEAERALFHHKGMNNASQTSLLSVANSAKSGDSDPIIPLSPDPFGRYPSSQDLTGGSQGTTYWDPANRSSLSIDTGVSAPSAELPPRSESAATSSRFSTDSLQGESAASQPTARQSSTKSTFGVKNLTKLWKLGGGKSSVSNPPPPPTPTVATYAGRISTDVPVPPRPSQDRLESPSAIGINTPTTPTFGGRRSPQLVPPQPQGQHPSASPAGASPQRPSTDSLNVPQQPHPHPQISPHPHHHPRSGRPSMSGSGMGMSPSPRLSPAGLDFLHFDQESPYPSRKYSPLPSSTPNSAPVSLPHSDHAGSHPSAGPTASVSPPDSSRLSTSGGGGNSIRKTILKGWKSGSTPSDQDLPRPSLDSKPPPGRPRKSSVHQYGSSSPEVIPPNPQIPDRFLQQQRQGSPLPPSLSRMANRSDKQRMGSSSSMESAMPRASMASSNDSGDTRPSFDASQFEMVSPRVGYAS